MSSYQNKTKEELIIELGKLQELNNSLVSSDKKKEKKYDAEEQMLREKDLLFRKLSANVPDLIFQFTRRTDGSYFVPIASVGIKNIFGCSPEDVLNDFTPIARVIYPEDAERVMNDIEYSAKHFTYFNCEYRVQLPGKEMQWILTKSTPEKLPDGSITWYGFSANITDRKKAEEILEESYNTLKIAGEIAKLGGWIVDLKDHSSYWSNEVTAIHEVPIGYSPLVEEGIGFYAPEWRDKITEVFTNCELYGIPYDEEMQILTSKGKRVWVRTIGEAVKDSRGKIIKVQGAFQDITERKIAEEALLAKMDELERFQKLTIGREITMVALKKEVNNLLNKLGEDNKYKIVE
jgi:PAS domain S-box-containing protein